MTLVIKVSTRKMSYSIGVIVALFLACLSHPPGSNAILDGPNPAYRTTGPHVLNECKSGDDKFQEKAMLNKIIRVRLPRGEVRKVEVKEDHTVEEISRMAGMPQFHGAEIERVLSGEKRRKFDTGHHTVRGLNLQHGDWLYFMKDPSMESHSQDTAAAVERMRMDRERQQNRGEVKQVATASEFEFIIKRAKGLVVIKVGATWCPPCQTMVGKYADMARDYPRVECISVDADNNSKNKIMPKEYRAEALPTFFFVENGKIIDTIKGAQPEELRNKIESHG